MRAVIRTGTVQFVVLLAELFAACAHAVSSADGGLAVIMPEAGGAGILRFLDWSMSFEIGFTPWGADRADVHSAEPECGRPGRAAEVPDEPIRAG